LEEFATNAAFTAAVDTALGVTGAKDAVRAALAVGVDQGETEYRSRTSGVDGSLNLRIKSWVLRGTDMPVIELIGIVGAAAAAALAPGETVATVLTALTSFASLCWGTWRKGGTLSKAEIGVLGFIEVHGPISVEELRTKAAGALALSAAEIENALLTLQEVELRDGEIVPLIRKDPAGHWRACTA
jgi:hypothetical protein